MPTKEEIEQTERDEDLRRRRDYIARVMDPRTYGITGRLATPDAFNAAILRMRHEGVNVVGPVCAIDHLPRNYHMSLRWEFFDQRYPVMTGPEGKQGNGTWYEQQGGGLSPSWGMLARLASLTGLRILSCRRSDDGSVPLYWSYHVRGEVKYFDGQTRPDEVDVPYDLREGSPEAAMVKGRDAKSVADQLARMRAKGAQRAETFAKSRLVRHMLGLDQKYTSFAADMPFVWPIRDYESPPDPELDRLIALKEHGLIGDLYGRQPRRTVLDIDPLALTDAGEPADYGAEAAALANRERVAVTPAASSARAGGTGRAAPPPSDARMPWDDEESGSGPPVDPPKPKGWEGTGYPEAIVASFCEAKNWGWAPPLSQKRRDWLVDYLTRDEGKADIDGFIGVKR